MQEKVQLGCEADKSWGRQINIVDVDAGFELNFNKKKRWYLKAENRRKTGYINGRQILVNIEEMVLSKEVTS